MGSRLRNLRLDELPQLFNVIKGEMSLIGPRPWVLSYYEWMTPVQKRRVKVRPGITGLAQVRGRNGISVSKKIEYDLEYVNQISFLKDFALVFRTIFKVFKMSVRNKLCLFLTKTI